MLSEITLDGYQLLHQYLTPLGFLLVCDFDCPFEEATSFSLLDHANFRLLSERTLAVPYGSYNLEEFHWLDAYSARLKFWQDDYFLLRLLAPAGLFRRNPQIKLRRIDAENFRITR